MEEEDSCSFYWGIQNAHIFNYVKGVGEVLCVVVGNASGPFTILTGRSFLVGGRSTAGNRSFLNHALHLLTFGLPSREEKR